MTSRWIPGNDFELLENGEEFFPRVFEAVRAARSRAAAWIAWHSPVASARLILYVCISMAWMPAIRIRRGVLVPSPVTSTPASPPASLTIAMTTPSSAGIRTPRELSLTGLDQVAGFVSRIESTALAELPGVDLVTRFGAETPHDLIRLLRPDVLVQDPVRAPETVAGGELLQEWGGMVRRPEREEEAESPAV